MLVSCLKTHLQQIYQCTMQIQIVQFSHYNVDRRVHNTEIQTAQVKTNHYRDIKALRKYFSKLVHSFNLETFTVYSLEILQLIFYS